MKRCTKCKIQKELTAFNNSSKSTDGKKSSCKECQKAYERKRKEAYEASGRPETALTGSKVCTKCKATKDLTKFYRRGDASGTYKSQCIECLRPVLNKYKKDNPGKRRALDMKRRAALLNRTPKWLTEDDYWLMEQAYEHAVEQSITHGIKFHVDHIIPLQGKYVSGFHCPSNLQVIPAKVNMSKGNKFTPKTVPIIPKVDIEDLSELDELVTSLSSRQLELLTKHLSTLKA